MPVFLGQLWPLVRFLIKCAGAFVSGAALGAACQVPSRYLVSAGLVAAAGWAAYLLTGGAGWSLLSSTYTATVCVTLASQLLARRKRVPATVFLIPGIFPLVPGGGMSLTAWSMLNDTAGAAAAHLYETLLAAGAIALGIFTVDTLFRVSGRGRGITRPQAKEDGGHKG